MYNPTAHPHATAPPRVSRSPTPQGFQQQPYPQPASVSPNPTTGRKRKTPPDAASHAPLPPPQHYPPMALNQQPYQQLVSQPLQQAPAAPSNDDDAAGSSSGGRALSTSKRAEQNRKAQRAFRERRDQHVKSLESRAQLVDAALASAEEANRRWEECRNLVDQLRAENAALRAALGAVSAAQAAIPHLNPMFAASRTLADLQAQKDQPSVAAAQPASNGVTPALAPAPSASTAPAGNAEHSGDDAKDDAS